MRGTPEYVMYIPDEMTLAGTGKTTIMKDKLRNMDPEVFSNMGINLNCFTDSLLLQSGMESVLEKKTGRTFG